MKTQDMTQGDPIRLILMFAVPLFIGNIFQQVYSVVDTMIAGYRLGDAAIAAIGATSSLYNLLIDFSWGMNSGYGIVIARAFGSGDREELRRAIATSMVLNVAVTVVMTVAAMLGIQPLMRLMHVPDSVFQEAYKYIVVILAGMLATILYNMFAGILRAVGNSRTPLYFLIFSSILNVALDALFVIVFNWGVAGAAAATVLAEGLSAALVGAHLWRNYRDLLPQKQHFRLQRARVKEMATTGGAMALMICVVDLGSVIYQRAINQLGAVYIVAHTASRKLIDMLMMPLSSIASANSTFISQNWGAKRFDRVSKTIKQVMGLEVAWGLFCAIIIYLGGNAAVRLLTSTTDSALIDNAVLSLRLHFSCYPALGVLLAMRTSMQAMGQKLTPMISSGLELGIKLIAGLWLIPSYGYICVCLAEPTSWILCMAFLLIVFASNNPIRKMKATIAAQESLSQA